MLDRGNFWAADCTSIKDQGIGVGVAGFLRSNNPVSSKV